MTYEIGGSVFEATEQSIEAFRYFEPGHPTAVGGMVSEMETFNQRIHGKRCLLDVGALFGLFSLVFTRDSESKAYAIEPSPVAFTVLEENCSLNPTRDIEPICIFAGRTSGREVNCLQDWMHVAAGDGPLCFPETTIDSLALSPDVMKIDVEGHEYAVLRGSMQTIQRCQPLIFLEIHPRSLTDGETIETLTSLLDQLGYKIEEIDNGSSCHWGERRVLCIPSA